MTKPAQHPFQIRFEEAVKASGARNRTEFARKLGVVEHPSKVANNWFSRDKRIPSAYRKQLVSLGISIDYINDNEGELETSVGLGPGSQSVGIDLARLRQAVEYVVDAYRYAHKPIDSRGVARLVAGVYDLLISDEPTNLIELGDRLKREVAGGRNVGQEQTGSPDKDVHGGVGR